MTDYFNTAGDLVARVDVFGARVDWVWETGASHRLVRVIDGGGSWIDVLWHEARVEIVAPVRSDGVVAITVVEFSAGQLISIINPVGETITCSYRETGGVLERIVSSQGTVTEVSYQELPNGFVVDRVRVLDSTSGAELATRKWDIVGANMARGWPTYPSEDALWLSGDGEFRYKTQLSDGVTRVVSEYNSLGIMIARQTTVSTSRGDAVVQEQQFVFPGTETGGVPDPQVLPQQYAKPNQTTVVFRDDAEGNPRRASHRNTLRHKNSRRNGTAGGTSGRRNHYGYRWGSIKNGKHTHIRP
jgi:hypothetical protein